MMARISGADILDEFSDVIHLAKDDVTPEPKRGNADPPLLHSPAITS